MGDRRETQGGEIGELRLPAFVRDPFGLVRRRWPWMALSLLGVLLLGAAVVHFRYVPTYRAKATVLVSSQQIREEVVRSAVATGAFDKISVMVGEALSSEALGAVIEKLDLYPELRPVLTPAELVAIARENTSIEAQASVGPQPFYETAGLFNISFRYTEPEKAALVANEVAESFVQAGVRLRRRQGQLATQLLRDRLAVAEALFRERETQFESFRARHRGDLGLADNDDLEESFADLRARLVQERAIYTDQHPNVRALQRELDGLSASLGRIQAARAEAKRLDRQVTVARRGQMTALERVQEAELSERLEAEGERGLASVLDRAVAPLRPERTRGVLLLLVLAAAVTAAAAAGVLLELRDPVVVNRNQLESEFDLPILGGVPPIR